MLLRARWLLPITSNPIRDGALWVEGQEIRAVGPAHKIVRAHPSQPIADFGEAVILPGLVDAHTHIDYTIMRGFLDGFPFVPWIIRLTVTKYRKLSAEDIAVSARFGALELIRSGVTTIADTTDTGAAFDAVLESGLRGIIYQELFGLNERAISKTMDALRTKLEAMRQRATDRVRVGISPHAPYTVCAELFRAVTAYALREGYPLCIHSAESPEETELLTRGKGEIAKWLKLRKWFWRPPGLTPVRYLHALGVLDAHPLLAHCVHVDGEEVKILADQDVSIAHCPKSNAKFAHGLAPLPLFLDAGIRVGLGNDSVGSNNIFDMFDEMRFALLVQRAARRRFESLNARRMVELATIGGAKALGLTDRIGSLEPGKRADVIAVDLSRSHCIPAYDPYSALVFAANATDVVFTMVDGHVLYDGNEVRTLDEETLRSAMLKLRDRLA